MSRKHTLTAILPCNDLDASSAFYKKLGFVVTSDYGNYRILADNKGGELHLNQAVMAGSCRAIIRSVFTSIPKTSMSSPHPWAMKWCTHQETSHGACMSLPVPTRTERSYELAGPQICEENKDIRWGANLFWEFASNLEEA